MARIKVVEESEATGDIQAAYEGARRQMGFVPSVIKLFSPWPEVFGLQQQVFQTVMLAQSALPNPVKEMIALVVSRANECAYCATHHGRFLVRYGVSEEVARQVGEDFRQAAVDAKTRQLLAYAHQLTTQPARTRDEDIEALRQVGWTDRQILEATVVAAQFNFINRIAEGLGADLEEAAAGGPPARQRIVPLRRIPA